MLDYVSLRVADDDRSTSYGACVLDPDGYNIEAVCHHAE